MDTESAVAATVVAHPDGVDDRDVDEPGVDEPNGRADDPAAGTLGGRIRRLRQDLGRTQRELAEPRYTRGFLAAVESGARLPSEEALRYLAEQLGVNVEDLRHGRPPGIAAELTTMIRTARRRLSRGELDAAVAELSAAVAQATRYQLPEQRCWARYYLGEARLHRGDVAGALAELTRAAALGDSVSAHVRAMVQGRIGHCLFIGGESARAVRLLEGQLRGLRAAGSVDADAELRLVTPLLHICLELDWQDRARRLVADARELMPRATHPEAVAHFHSVASQLPQHQDDLDTMESMVGTARRLYGELGLEREIGMCHWSRGYVMRRLGRLEEAGTEFRLARQILHRVRAVQDYGGVTLEFAEVRRLQGALDDAFALAHEAGDILTSSGYVEGMAETERLLARLAATTGRAGEAEELFRRAITRYGQAGVTQEQVTTIRELADLLLGEGRLDEALEALRHGVTCAEDIR